VKCVYLFGSDKLILSQNTESNLSKEQMEYEKKSGQKGSRMY
jgi:hypothetical protein